MQAYAYLDARIAYKAALDRYPAELEKSYAEGHLILAERAQNKAASRFPDEPTLRDVLARLYSHWKGDDFYLKEVWARRKKYFI